MSAIASATQPRMREKRFQVRVRSFNGTSIEDVVNVLRKDHFTGKVIIDMSQGGVCSMQVEDRFELPTLTSHQ